jgi:hypothetical protein
MASSGSDPVIDFGCLSGAGAGGGNRECPNRHRDDQRPPRRVRANGCSFWAMWAGTRGTTRTKQRRGRRT